MGLTFAFKQCLREKANAEFRLLAGALGIAVFAVTLLMCLTQVIQQGVTRNSSQLLGADLIIESTDPIPAAFMTSAAEKGLQHTAIIEFFSMIMLGDKMQLASISAFSQPYPLRGELRLTTQSQVDAPVVGLPDPGEIWIHRHLQQLLNASLNQTVRVGNSQLKVTGIITQYPIGTSANNIWSPVAHVNAKDIPQMGVLQPGSRATYQLLIAGSAQARQDYWQQWRTHLPREVRWITPDSGRRGVSETFIKAQRFIVLAAILQLFLAGIAIALCAYQYAMGQQRKVALWRCFGATSRFIVQTHMTVIVALGCVVMLVSIIAAYVATLIVLHYVKDWGIDLSALTLKGALFGALSGFAILIGFALPPIVGLRKVSAMIILQSNHIFPRLAQSSFIFAIVILAGLLFYFMDQYEIALHLGIILLIIGILLFALAWLLWQLLPPLMKIGPLAWRFAIGYLTRHRWQSIIQYLVFTLVVSLLLLIQILRHDFVSQWQQSLSPSTPNYFLVNIQGSQIPAIKQWFQTKGIYDVTFHPIVRARVSGLDRPINLTWTAHIPEDNKIVEGVAWHTDPNKLGISIEQGFAERQGLKMGDQMSFTIQDQTIMGTISQIRSVEWGSFKPNFFVIFHPHVLDNFPNSYITSVYVPPNKRSIMTELVQQYVEISVIDIGMFITQIRALIDKLSIALLFLLSLVFAIGILIMYAALLFSEKERIQENGLLRIIGAQRAFVSQALLLEFVVIGALTGVSATLIANLLAHDLAQHYFSIVFDFHWYWAVLAIGLSIILIPLFGLVGSRTLFTSLADLRGKLQ